MNRQHDSEPVLGLPEALPEGEVILWQGAPNWRRLARKALFTRLVAAYFAVMALFVGANAWEASGAFGDGVIAAAAVLPAAAAAIGVLALIAYLTAKTTLYTITNRRVVFRYGVALTLCANVPHRKIGRAAVKLYRDGTGELPLSLTGEDRFSYVMLWPNARPWRFARPEPMLRCVPEAARVAEILSEALKAVDAPAARAASATGAAAPAAAEAKAPMAGGVPA